MKYMDYDFKIKAVEGKRVRIAGYANKAIYDSVNELVVPKGVQLDRYRSNPILLFMHDREKPIGKVIDVEARDEGIYVEAEISMSDDPIVKYARNMIKEGILKTFSIGFEEVDSDRNADGTINITKSNLLEISVVTIPANAESTFEVKALAEKKSYKDVRLDVLHYKGAWVAEAIHGRIYELQADSDDFSRMGALEAVAEQAGVEMDVIMNVLAGNLTPTPEGVLAAFAEVLGMDAERLAELDSGDVQVEGAAERMEEEEKPKMEDDAEEEQKKEEAEEDEPKACGGKPDSKEDDSDMEKCVSGKMPGYMRDGKTEAEAIAMAISECEKELGKACNLDEAFLKNLLEAKKKEEPTAPVDNQTTETNLGSGDQEIAKSTLLMVGELSAMAKNINESLSRMIALQEELLALQKENRAQSEANNVTITEDEVSNLAEDQKSLDVSSITKAISEIRTILKTM